jgi:hypothetical protein
LFELIGLAFATIFLFALSAVAGTVFIGVAWLIMRKKGSKTPSVLIAGAIPVLSAAYLWLCVAILPGESLFGDISQPLPNGYSLEALGKMPDFATIKQGNSLSNPHGQSECIGSLAVYGPFVAGRYSHPFGTFVSEPNEGYFILDTRDGQFADFKTIEELETRLDRKANLVTTTSFRSSEHSYERRQTLNKVIMFTPPVIATITYFLWLSRKRRPV